MARFDKDKAFKNIVGVESAATMKEPANEAEVVAQEATQPAYTLAPAEVKERLIQKSYYITERQYKALKLKAAMSDDPHEKDLSAIVRAALDAYLKTGD